MPSKTTFRKVKISYFLATLKKGQIHETLGDFADTHFYMAVGMTPKEYVSLDEVDGARYCFLQVLLKLKENRAHKYYSKHLKIIYRCNELSEVTR